MTYTPIPRGTQDWDVPVNNAFTDQDIRITQNTADILTDSTNINALQSAVATNTTNIATNTANIATNTANIATNTANIAAVTTTANAAVPKDAQVWNVKDHGAIGDGIANDTTAIQNTINLATAGGVIYFPPGSYLLNSGVGLSVSNGATALVGAGPEASKLIVGASFTGPDVIAITGANCRVENLSINGASGTTTSNPAAGAIRVTGVRRTRLTNLNFNNINGWCIQLLSSGVAQGNPLGSQITKIYANSCAGGIHFKGDAAQARAMNCSVTDYQSYLGGVASGASANLDGIWVEDAWDVLFSNIITWMQNGSGSAFHVQGDTAATFVKNLDALGPNAGTGSNVLINANANGSPQNVQIDGGVIQQGSVGLLISDASTHVRVTKVRFINNTTHGIQVNSTAPGIYITDSFVSGSGSGATGTNYDVNWNGTATGFITNCRFTSPIVSIGVAGVQQTINVAAGQNVRVVNADFQGTAAASTNWFTNFPQFVSHADGTNMEFIGNVDFRLNTARLQLAPNAATNNVLATNVASADAFDRFRLLGNGNMQFGTGAAARDVTWGRTGTTQIGSSDSDIATTLAGKTFVVKNGANSKAGTVTANGTTTVNQGTTAATANSTIILSYKSGTQAAGGTAWVSGLTAGTGFAIKSLAGDTATYNWVIIEQA